MRLTPADLRIVRRGGLIARFAELGPVVYIVAELGQAGSAGTSLEEPCMNPHWGLVLSGEMDVERDGSSLVRLEAGHAFHIPAGEPAHRFRAQGRLAVVGFVPLSGPAIDDHQILQAGFEIIDEPGASPDLTPTVDVTVSMASEVVPLRRGQIDAESTLMGEWVLCATRFGGVSGYTSSWCDLPHWGIVIRGAVAIEWEVETEIVSAGEAFYCPAGPPGHRIEVTDAAAIMDFTPLQAMVRPGRMADWRPRLSIAAPGPNEDLVISGSDR